MTIPREVTDFLERIEAPISRIASEAKSILDRIAGESEGFYFDRKKKAQSLYDKLIKGDISSLINDCDDLYAGTIVVPVRSRFLGIDSNLRQSFEIVEVKENRVEQPETFKYDDLHYILRLKRQAYEDNALHHELKFEVQVKTLLQHTHSRITHDILYKSGNDTVKQVRLASQLRAIFEMADGLIENLDVAERILQFNENELAQRRRAIKTLLTDIWGPRVQGMDLRRASITVDSYLGLARTSVDELRTMLTTPPNDKLVGLESVTPALVVLEVLLAKNTALFLGNLARRDERFKTNFFIPESSRGLLPNLASIPQGNLVVFFVP